MGFERGIKRIKVKFSDYNEARLYLKNNIEAEFHTNNIIVAGKDTIWIPKDRIKLKILPSILVINIRDGKMVWNTSVKFKVNKHSQWNIRKLIVDFDTRDEAESLLKMGLLASFPEDKAKEVEGGVWRVHKNDCQICIRYER